MIKYPARRSKRRHFLGMALLLCLPPLLGVAYLDLPPARYLEFPPQTQYVVHAPFSWPVFTGLALFVTVICLPFIHRLTTYRPTLDTTAKKTYPFPWWGWLGIAGVIITWIIAWNRLPVFSLLQRYTFTPLWLGYILVVNAVTFKRRGDCLPCSHPRFFLALFPASAVFWWYFEYINRFVQNWYYLGGENISAFDYVVHASICFSTVLPAVLSTCAFLCTFPRLTGAFADWYPVKLHLGRRAGWLLLALAAGSLSLLAVLPDYLFPLVWIAPLFVIVGFQLVGGRKSLFSDLEQGNWQRIVIPALAALLCGFFWEMWNWKSLAHWEYSIPFVHRFQLFAMPLLGYAGYLPFGVVCTEAGALLKAKTAS